MEDNKLIAEFMGWELQDNPKERWYGSYREPNGAGYYHRNTTTDPLLFHCSWDWLMPVIKKCFCTGDNTFEWDAIMDAMWTCDIKIVHSVVVEFIKEHNKTI